jgi:diguanylate cyclase (GGDEF)-like protein
MIASLAMVVGIGLFDYYEGQQISSSAFYVVPALLAGWYVGMAPGVLVCILSTISFYLTEVLWGATEVHPLAAAWNTIVPLLFLLLLVGLAALLKAALIREEELSRTDPLTGLYNRRYFAELAGAEIRRADRYPHPVSLAYMDIDDFKSINDTRGHAAGDELLRTVADILSGALRRTDTIGRMGGDEFAVLLPDGGPEASEMVVKKLHESLTDGMRAEGFPVTVSIGLVTFMKPPGSFDEMLGEADRVMYEVKRAGKNSVESETLGS